MASGKLSESEFEGQIHKSGVFDRHKAFERLRLIVRTEQDPDGADLDATPDKFEHGGVEGDTPGWWVIR